MRPGEEAWGPPTNPTSHRAAAVPSPWSRYTAPITAAEGHAHHEPSLAMRAFALPCHASPGQAPHTFQGIAEEAPLPPRLRPHLCAGDHHERGQPNLVGHPRQVSVADDPAPQLLQQHTNTAL
jgi:hypothetical protein